MRPDTTAQFEVAISIVTPGYFETMRIPLCEAGSSRAADRLSEEALTAPAERREERRAAWCSSTRRSPNDSGPGRIPSDAAIRLLRSLGRLVERRSSASWATCERPTIATPAEPTIYVPLGRDPGFRLAIAVRARPGVEGIAPAMRARLRALDPQMLVSSIRPHETP